MKKYIDLEDMVNTNCSNVLDIIQKNENISRKRITELTGLSWGGMTKIVNKLLENGYIVEKKSQPTSKSGRIPSIISVNNQKNYIIGLDINNVGFKGIVMNLSGQILKTYQKPVVATTKDQLLKEIISFTDMIFSNFKADVIVAIGVAMQGIVDSKNGISVKYPGISDWKNISIRTLLAEKFKVHVFIEHDPDCLLYSYINNSSSKNISLFRIDKSIGMAVSLNGKILKGKGILEIAHNTVIPNGKMCSCGMKGCLEAYISSDDKTHNSIDDFLLPLCITIKNSVNLFNSDTVIITGDLMNDLKSYESKLLKMLQDFNCSAQIKFCEIADNAVLGVSLLAIRNTINSLEI